MYFPDRGCVRHLRHLYGYATGRWYYANSIRVKYKVACVVRQSLSGQAPLYLAEI